MPNSRLSTPSTQEWAYSSRIRAIDDMKLNTGMEDMSEKNQYILSYLPVVKQKTYTLGAVYKHYAGKKSLLGHYQP